MSPRITPQGVNSQTFNAAPFDHDLSVPGLYEYHAKHSPNHVIYTYTDLDTSVSHDVLYSQAWDDIRKVANIVKLEANYTKSRMYAENPKARPIIGILALSDSLSYVYLMVAIMSLGYTGFPLSPRNSPIVNAHLLGNQNVVQLYVSDDPAMQTLAQEANRILTEKGKAVELEPMVRYVALQTQGPVEAGSARKTGVVDIADWDVTLILHSSGTTAFPKPIPITRRGLLNISKIPCFGEVDLAGKRIAAHTNPIFHAMGLATILWPLTSGATFAVYKPSLPPVTPTPANFFKSWMADKCNMLFCIPVFIEAWARDPSNIPHLKALDCIVFSGASVNKSIGDMLAREGVVLHPFWGSTEAGPATMYVPRDPPPPEDWEYFKFSHHVEFHMQPQENMDGIYEPIMIPTSTCFPQVLNSELEGKPVYAVGDLLEQHPTDPNRWKVFGRKDEQIMLSTAENVNPIPIEDILVHDEHIAAVIMFGRNHMEPGVLIEPVAGFAVQGGNTEACAAFIDLIWPTVEKANARAPAYAHIRPHRILIASPLKPLERTPKGTPRRSVCLELYASEIEEIYKDEEDPTLAATRQFPDRI